MGSNQDPRRQVPVLKPSDDPFLIHLFLQLHFPNADRSRMNTLSNNNALSPLLFKLATTPTHTHGWLVFRCVQKRVIRGDISQWYDSSHSATHSSSTPLEISRVIYESWSALDDPEIAEWDDLALDIRNAHSQLVFIFGNGIIFEGNLWEWQRSYHLRSIYLKWVGARFLYAHPG
ncbi:hypothetical protein CPB86DRAFT_874187 [Serendipita vermifera]|nr:hypothetical protein CPB86DRAFT_874187 [Serendipita vermifera]